MYKSIGQPVGRLANRARVCSFSFLLFFAMVCFTSRCSLTPCLPLARFTTEKIGRRGERSLCSLSKSHKISNGIVGATKIETLQFQLEDSMSQRDFFFPYTFREGIPHHGRLPLCNRRFLLLTAVRSVNKSRYVFLRSVRMKIRFLRKFVSRANARQLE